VIEGWDGHQWKELCQGTAIGHKKIDRIESTEASRVRLRVTASAATPVIRKLAVYRTADQTR
jgi:alpha-L-fucosidase